MNISHISVTRASVWDTCAQQYRYKYHLKIPSPLEEPIYFLYGKVVHKIGEEFCLKKGEKPIGEIATDVLNGKVPLERSYGGNAEAIKLPAEYKRKLPEHLRAMKRLFDQTGTDGLLEFAFEHELDDQGRKVIGFIDRLIKRDGKFFIVDYKTTKQGPWRKNNQTVTSDLQLRTYAKVVQKAFGAEAKDIRAGLYYLEGGEMVAARFSQQSLDAAEAELLTVYKQIQQSDPDHVVGSVGQHCKRCDYQSICPFVRNQRRNQELLDMSEIQF